MSFTPKSEEEIKRDMVWEADEYDFEVVGCEPKTSKKGNEMLEVTLEVYHPAGGTQKIKDWLVASDAPLNLMKLRHFCASVGSLDAYATGDLSQFPGVGAAGRVKLKLEESEEYGPQNRVADYVEPSSTNEMVGVSGFQQQNARKNAPDKEEIPF